MNPILKNILAVIMGWLGGSIVNIVLIELGHKVFPIAGVDFNDMDTTYLKVNTPMGIYLKWGNVSTDIDIKETMLSGNTYKNTSVDGTSMGAGYQKTFGERGFGFRIEGNYVELDNVTVNNGVTKTAGTGINNFKEIKASNLEGLTGKIALTYTFGRSGNSF